MFKHRSMQLRMCHMITGTLYLHLCFSRGARDIARFASSVHLAYIFDISLRRAAVRLRQ